MSDFIQLPKGVKILTNAGQVSDGYHTFDELYHYRMLYHAAFVNELWKRCQSEKHDYVPIKSFRHSDGEPCFGGGWFVVTVELPTGQITNHYQDRYWRLFQIPEAEFAPAYDGHTPQEAADRLERYLRGDWGEQQQ